MRKTFPLRLEGKHPDRLLDATKHEIRKYLRRERRRALPKGMDYWDFDCRFGATADAAEPAAVGALIGLIDAQVQAGGAQFYVEILARAAKRLPRAPGALPASADGLDEGAL
ncbi:MAG: hypothetical protein F9K35_20735 [Burkholderiaceae bacterium]|nr:MAG: hypothetical protein F9K35_20735 [Burkholderiaceae bacterium]